MAKATPGWRNVRRGMICAFSCSLAAGCSYSIDQKALFPTLAQPATSLVAPEGYTLTEKMLPVGNLGVVHSLLLQREGSNATVIFSGGNGYFTATGGKFLAHLASATRANIVTYDYPGRGGTSIPATADAMISSGPLLIQAMHDAGFIKPGPVFGYGFSFGGSQAAAIARVGGFKGLILDATSPDIAGVGRNLLPSIAKPFVSLKVAEDLKKFEYYNYVMAAKVPILLLGGKDDRPIPLRLVQTFAEKLKMDGANVTFVVTPGGHGQAIKTEEGEVAVSAFLAKNR